MARLLQLHRPVRYCQLVLVVQSVPQAQAQSNRLRPVRSVQPVQPAQVRLSPLQPVRSAQPVPQVRVRLNRLRLNLVALVVLVGRLPRLHRYRQPGLEALLHQLAPQAPARLSPLQAVLAVRWPRLIRLLQPDLPVPLLQPDLEALVRLNLHPQGQWVRQAPQHRLHRYLQLVLVGRLRQLPRYFQSVLVVLEGRLNLSVRPVLERQLRRLRQLRQPVLERLELQLARLAPEGRQGLELDPYRSRQCRSSSSHDRYRLRSRHPLVGYRLWADQHRLLLFP